METPHPFIGRTVTVVTSLKDGCGWWRSKLLGLTTDYIYLSDYIIAREPGMYIQLAPMPARTRTS